MRLSLWVLVENEMAERERFELSVGFNTYGGLANHCFRPLSHLSAAAGKVLGLIVRCKKKLGEDRSNCFRPLSKQSSQTS
jgi:hypothetical protein